MDFVHSIKPIIDMPIHTDLTRDTRVLNFPPRDLVEAMSYEVLLRCRSLILLARGDS